MTEHPPLNGPAAADQILVACLCAAWCRVCEDYAAVFKSLCEQRPDWRFVWVDIEDEAELMGDLEVETFPTLLVSRGGLACFLGPVLPQQAAAQRLIEAVTAPGAGRAGADPAASALLERLLARP